MKALTARVFGVEAHKPPLFICLIHLVPKPWKHVPTCFLTMFGLLKRDFAYFVQFLYVSSYFAVDANRIAVRSVK